MATLLYYNILLCLSIDVNHDLRSNEYKKFRLNRWNIFNKVQAHLYSIKYSSDIGRNGRDKLEQC